MTMAARVAPAAHVCPSTPHRHDPTPSGGRCAFPDSRRSDGLCGREPVAVYVNPKAKVRNTYRCQAHDQDVVVEAAARDGFRRIALRSRA